MYTAQGKYWRNCGHWCRQVGTPSPKREGSILTATPTEGSVSAGGSPVRAKCRSDLGAEVSLAKEAKRQAMAEAAQTSLKNMESRSLEGLGDFGLTVSRGCKQVPLRNLMGAGKP